MKTYRKQGALRDLAALARYETHGGYTWAMLANDGAMICAPCVLSEYRQIFKATRDKVNDGWRCVGLASSGDSECLEMCAHCSRELWDTLP